MAKKKKDNLSYISISSLDNSLDVDCSITNDCDPDERALAENPDLLEHILNSDKGNQKHKEKYIVTLYSLVGFWSFFVVLLLILQGWNIFSFHLADSVINTFLVAVFGQVLGGIFLLSKQLFKENGHMTEYLKSSSSK
jgi:uncharacterized membrane protein